MKKILLLTFLISTSLSAQINESDLNEKKLAWGDYYFFNKEYQKAISFYLDYEGKMPDENIRNLAKAYYKIGLVEESKKYASILGYNYQSSKWYEKSYKIFNKEYKKPTIKKNKKKSLIVEKIKQLLD